MYRHYLVPVDGTQLSVDTAAQAVFLASETKSKITFLYATPDFKATSDGALLFNLNPEKFTKGMQGRTDAILAKVAALAKAKGVDYDTASLVTDHPYVAIIQTAKEKGCDLIFMASHGERGISGLLRGSQTEKVLHHSPIAVLVASVEGNV
jgi:nucleotide-binding universal stress UspA family protein